MDDKNKIFSRVFYLAVIAVLVLLALQKVHDTDVWLHLGLGKYMVEHRSLPAKEIFTYTDYGRPAEYFEWLFEILLYLLYQAGGYNGLMVFKLGLWLLTMSLLWQWMKTEGVESRWAAFFTLFPAYLLAARWQERPEVVGYFFLALYILTWSLYRRRRGNYLYFLPLVQVLWMNLHPSAMLGIMVFMIILAGEGIDYFWDKKRENLRVIKALAVTIPVLLGVSFINPYGYRAVIFPYLYTTNKAIQSLIAEWLPIWRFELLPYIYLAFLIPAVLSFIPLFSHPRKNLKFAEAFLFALGAFLPLRSGRHIILLGLISLPLAVKNYYWFFRNWTAAGRFTSCWNSRIHKFRWVLPILPLLTGAVLFGLSFKVGLCGWGIQKYAVPIRALSFIQENRLPGRIYNEFTWGGYITLSAYPDYLAYIDSRDPSLEVLRERILIETAAPGWEEKLEQRRVNLIIMRSLYPLNGWIIPMIAKLIPDPDWVLVWSEDATLVFLRNSPENQYWVKKFALPKDKIYEEITLEGRYLLDNKVKRFTYGSMAWAYSMQGNFAEARKAYEEHLKLNPQDQEARNYLEFLKRHEYGK